MKKQTLGLFGSVITILALTLEQKKVVLQAHRIKASSSFSVEVLLTAQ